MLLASLWLTAAQAQDPDAIHAGANPDVKVSADGSVANSFLAVLTVDGQVVAQQVVRADD